MLIAGTDALRWALTGHQDENGMVERDQAAVYAGIGYAARPPAEGSAEAIVLTVETSANHTVIVAARDQQTTGAVVDAVGLEANETLMHNADLIIKITKDREILLGLPGGEYRAVALADHTHQAPAISGQAAYVDGTGARTGPPNKVSTHVKVT